MTSQLHNAKLGLILPAILNPATAAVVGIGLGLLWLLRDDEQDATVDDVPIKLPSSAVTTVVQPVLTVDQRPSEPALEAYEPRPHSTSARNYHRRTLPQSP